jgi:hypothetical protein
VRDARSAEQLGREIPPLLPCRVLNPAPASLSACRGVLVSVAAFAINRCTSPGRYTAAHEEGSNDQNVEAIIVRMKAVSSPSTEVDEYR